jgi:very-short-patch-repair endonuclease
MDTKEFANRSNKIHEKYDYSLVEFRSYKEKVKIICPEHGVFEQTPNNHLYGKKGCKFCANNVKYTKKEVINKFKECHGDKYDYSKIKFNGVFKKVDIICKKHGIFKQTAKSHFSGSGCLKCVGKNKTTKEVIIEFKKIHGDRYDYSLVEYSKAKEKIKIICHKHGVFKQTPDSHKSKKGCSKCNMSKGEKKIKEILKELNIKFNLQKKFKECVNPETNKKLLFDFYLPDYNMCIEYDGEQHYLPMRFSNKNNSLNLELIQKRDKIKNEFCKGNKITLLRIKYTKLNEIDDILNKTFINRVKLV